MEAINEIAKAVNETAKAVNEIATAVNETAKAVNDWELAWDATPASASRMRAGKASPSG